MPDKHAKALEVMNLAENYNNWIYEKIKRHIGGVVLEIGCGIGNFTKYLANAERLFCVDLLKECIGRTQELLNYKSNVKYICGDFLDPKVFNELGRNKFDTIICLNVLEHISDDQKAIGNMASLLSSEGKLLLIVPAMQSIYGSLDSSLGHIKRYNKNDLKNLLQNGGFELIELKYFNSLGVVGWYLNGKTLKRNNLSKTQALIYDKLFIPILSFIETFIDVPFGMSLLAVAKKHVCETKL